MTQCLILLCCTIVVFITGIRFDFTAVARLSRVMDQHEYVLLHANSTVGSCWQLFDSQVLPPAQFAIGSFVVKVCLSSCRHSSLQVNTRISQIYPIDRIYDSHDDNIVSGKRE